MKHQTIGTITFHVDPSVPAVYVYLRDTEGFRSCRTVSINDEVNIDLDADGHVIGVEMLGPGSLDVVLNTVVPQYHLEQLEQLSQHKKMFDDLFQPV